MGHRQFLPRNHPYWRQKKAFNGEQDFRIPPKILSGEEILEKVDLIPISWGKMKIKSLESDVNTNCWKKKVHRKYLHVLHNLDVMHIEKNVCESIIGTLFNIPGKQKNGLNAQLDLVEMGLRSEIFLRVDLKRTYLPAACHSLSKN